MLFRMILYLQNTVYVISDVLRGIGVETVMVNLVLLLSAVGSFPSTTLICEKPYNFHFNGKIVNLTWKVWLLKSDSVLFWFNITHYGA